MSKESATEWKVTYLQDKGVIYGNYVSVYLVDDGSVARQMTVSTNESVIDDAFMMSSFEMRKFCEENCLIHRGVPREAFIGGTR